MFIVLEGLDGAGKTTLRNLLTVALRGEGEDVIVTQEPGGTPLAEKFRNLCKYGSEKYDESFTEATRLCLLSASRSQHLEHVIRPGLKAGKIVLCDRFFWSTLAYTDKATFSTALTLHNVLGNVQEPDLTIYLDVDKETSMARRGLVATDDIEKKMYSRFDEARLTYLELAATDSNAVTLDARLPPETLFAKAMMAISEARMRLENESKRIVAGQTDHPGSGGDSAQ